MITLLPVCPTTGSRRLWLFSSPPVSCSCALLFLFLQTTGKIDPHNPVVGALRTSTRHRFCEPRLTAALLIYHTYHCTLHSTTRACISIAGWWAGGGAVTVGPWLAQPRPLSPLSLPLQPFLSLQLHLFSLSTISGKIPAEIIILVASAASRCHPQCPRSLAQTRTSSSYVSQKQAAATNTQPRRCLHACHCAETRRARDLAHAVADMPATGSRLAE